MRLHENKFLCTWREERSPRVLSPPNKSKQGAEFAGLFGGNVPGDLISVWWDVSSDKSNWGETSGLGRGAD